ncbi:MAG: heavy-metal-associated domain-containing protein [Cyanobacteria bacterium P01_A01_bin.17]
MIHQLQVPSMACSACVDTITQAVHKIDTAAAVEADPKTKIVQVTTEQSEAVVKDAIATAGYPVS